MKKKNNNFLTTARWTPSPFLLCASRHCGSESTSSCLRKYGKKNLQRITLTNEHNAEMILKRFSVVYIKALNN